ncbi:MAG: response regulator [Planctomycetes bacterium]|nr:response regulator [Planctomycetota bacterium]
MTKLLVVDDSALDRKIVGRLIEEQGLSPVYAENGREALTVLERERPEAVLTDLRMPEMDGLELVGEIRQRFSTVPVILMTAHGSEEIAVKALRAGAASYVTKKSLRQDLAEALRVVLATIESSRDREQVCKYLQRSESHFVIGYEPDGPRALISYLQGALSQLGFCDDVGLTQVSTAFVESLANAIDHGNLELDSTLRDSADNSYRKVGNERSKIQPYRDRRVHVTTELTCDTATFIVRDEGPRFDVSRLPDPTDPENFLKPSGRGVMLIRTFMDDVSHNAAGNEITMKKHRAR